MNKTKKGVIIIVKKKLIIMMVLILSLGLVACMNSDVEDMVLVEAGTTSEDNGSVTVEYDFYIGKYHITQEEFEEVMGFNPSPFDGNPDHPVVMVTWYDAVKYCNKLSEEEGLEKYYNIIDIEYKGDNAKPFHHTKNIDSANVTENEGANGYRLPTESEHEYAARGGKDGEATIYAGSNDLDEVGWYGDNSDFYKWVEFERENDDLKAEDLIEFLSNNSMTKSIGEKKANELGLYDMSGNVSDWTNTLEDSRRILRGGGWIYVAEGCEVDDRIENNPSKGDINLGFRLSKTK